MAMNPDEIYQIVDRKLRDRNRIIAMADAALERAMEYATGGSTPVIGSGRKGGNTESRTQRAAIMLATAEEQVQEARKWAEVFRRLDKVFPAKTTNEGFVASLIYGNGMSQQDVCRFCKCDRKTVRRRQDRYIHHAALLAASYGLIDGELKTDDDQ